MRWASAISTSSRLEDAIGEASESILANFDEQPDLVIAFVASAHSNHYRSLPASLRERFPDAVLFGCCGSGIIGNHVEVEAANAVSLIAAQLPGVDVSSFHLGKDPEEWAGQVGVDPEACPELVVLADPFSCSPETLIPWLDAAYPESTKIGAIASGCRTAGECVLLQGDELHRVGAVGLALSGNIEIDTIVAQGCKPVGEPMFATRAGGSVVQELDGRPAVEMLETLMSSLDDDDRRLARDSLFLGIVMHDKQEIYEHGDFLIRQIIGIDPEAQAVAIAGEIREGAVVQFHLRDAHTSAADLREHLSKHQYSRPEGALLFSCVGRGEKLYGQPSHDSELFRSQIGDVPMSGFFGNGEIGPVQGRTFLHTFTSVIGLLRPKQR